jgi:hypothetical protein
MSTFFDVSPIGNSINRQKGPTCWFYAAKMVRKFHDAYDKMDGSSNIRLLSLVRKIITFMDEDLRTQASIDDAPNYADTSLTSFRSLSVLAKMPFTEMADPFGKMLYIGILRFAATLNKRPTASTQLPPPITIDLTDDSHDPMASGTAGSGPIGPPTPSDYESVLKLMLAWGRESDFSRQAILSMWSFEQIPKLDLYSALQSAENFEALLKKYGPLWAGGFFETKELMPLTPGEKRPIMGVGAARDWVMQWKLIEKLENTHAIAIAGVGTGAEKLILYRDPNFSQQMCTLPFDQFKLSMSPLKDNAISLMYYKCPRCSNPGPSSCINQSVKRLTVKLGIVPEPKKPEATTKLSS